MFVNIVNVGQNYVGFHTSIGLHRPTGRYIPEDRALHGYISLTLWISINNKISAFLSLRLAMKFVTAFLMLLLADRGLCFIFILFLLGI
jgi:hypothetical protein